MIIFKQITESKLAIQHDGPSEENHSDMENLKKNAEIRANELKDAKEMTERLAQITVRAAENVAELEERNRELNELNEELNNVNARLNKLIVELKCEKAKAEQALAEVRLLRGIIPICMHCHKIRSDAQDWTKLESYIEGHSDAQFSHGICPKCLDDHYKSE